MISKLSFGDVRQIQETYRDRYQKIWDTLTQQLYAKYGKLDLEDVLPPMFE